MNYLEKWSSVNSVNILAVNSTNARNRENAFGANKKTIKFNTSIEQGPEQLSVEQFAELRHLLEAEMKKAG